MTLKMHMNKLSTSHVNIYWQLHTYILQYIGQRNSNQESTAFMNILCFLNDVPH